jgi:hypothetical protein
MDKTDYVEAWLGANNEPIEDGVIADEGSTDDETLFNAGEDEQFRKSKGPHKYLSYAQWIKWVMRSLSSTSTKPFDWHGKQWVTWAGKLFQKWLLTQYFRMVEDRVSYLKQSQKNLKAVISTSLMNAYEKMLKIYAEKSIFLNY